MPITLGCPSCGKRFRARDESVGKRVKCPFCQAAVPVPSPDEAHNAASPSSEPLAGAASGPGAEPVAPPPPSRPLMPPVSSGKQPPPPPAAPGPVSTGDWGSRGPADMEVEPGPRPVFPVAPAPGRPKPPAPPPALPTRDKAKRPAREPKTPMEQLAAGWSRAASGLFWVKFGLFWVALIGFVPFGKVVYERSVGDLPKGEGWVKISGYVNTNDPDAIRIDREEELQILLYGVPLVVGGLALSLGRLTAGAAPRNSGAKGLFGFAGLFTLVAVAAGVTYFTCQKLRFDDIAGYSRLAATTCGGLAEFWFLLGLGAAGATLRRPAAVRAVGFYALVLGLAWVVIDVGWGLYVKELGPKIGRPQKPDDDWRMYDAAAMMLGWLIIVGSYWRAVSGVRAAAKEFVARVADGTADRMT